MLLVPVRTRKLRLSESKQMYMIKACLPFYIGFYSTNHFDAFIARASAIFVTIVYK